LAVGDAEFQKKCLGKMGDVAKEGRTVLFVSHNMTAVQRLCTRCIWLDNGAIHQIGETSEVIQAYQAKSYELNFQGEMNLTEWPNRYGRGGARILSARLLDANNNITTTFQRSKPMSFEFDFKSSVTHVFQFSSIVISESGDRILHLSHHDTPGLSPGIMRGKYSVRFTIPSLPLNEGNYRLLLGIHTENDLPIDVTVDVLPFEVLDIKNSPRPYKTVVKYAYCWTPNKCSITQIH
jgi:lipopolysaccharide transport system ATP-binding protein